MATVPVEEVRNGDFNRVRPVYDPATTVGTRRTLRGSLSYHGMVAKAEKRLSKGLTFLASYTRFALRRLTPPRRLHSETRTPTSPRQGRGPSTRRGIRAGSSSL